MFECNKCESFGLKFKRNYQPDQFIEGHLDSKIWIIGLNPAEETDWTDPTRTVEDLKSYLNTVAKIPPYFKNFEKVSSKLFNGFCEKGGTAHTDLVKCSSKSWPPKGLSGKETSKIIENCKPYLLSQLNRCTPKIIVCNGAPVCSLILDILPPQKNITHEETNYITEVEGKEIRIILSGFVGRLDNYSRRRLGLEIERFM